MLRTLLMNLIQLIEAVEVRVKAEDEGGLSFEVSFTLTANAPPELADTADDVDTSVEFTLGEQRPTVSQLPIDGYQCTERRYDVPYPLIHRTMRHSR